MDVAAYTNRIASFSVEKFLYHRIFCDRVISFQPGQRGVVSNGKVSVLIARELHSRPRSRSVVIEAKATM